MTNEEIVVVLDAGPLAERLFKTAEEPFLPALSYGRAVLAFTPALLAGAAKRLEEMGLGAADAARFIASAERRGLRVDPGASREVYEDAARDEGLRLAVAADAAFYLSDDDDVVALGEWKGVRVVGSWNEVLRELLAREETALAFRASSEVEATRVAEALEEAGVDFYVAPQQVPWYDGVLVMGQGYWGDVVVFRKDLQRAQRIINNITPAA